MMMVLLFVAISKAGSQVYATHSSGQGYRMVAAPARLACIRWRDGRPEDSVLEHAHEPTIAVHRYEITSTFLFLHISTNHSDKVDEPMKQEGA